METLLENRQIDLDDQDDDDGADGYNNYESFQLVRNSRSRFFFQITRNTWSTRNAVISIAPNVNRTVIMQQHLQITLHSDITLVRFVVNDLVHAPHTMHTNGCMDSIGMLRVLTVIRGFVMKWISNVTFADNVFFISVSIDCSWNDMTIQGRISV